MSELVTEAIADGSIHNNMQPTHVAFTLESINRFLFFSHMIRSVIWDIFENGTESTYLEEALNTYLSSITN